MKRVRDAGFIGWRGVDSDHRAVYVRMNLARYLKLKRRPVGPKPSRIDRGMLNELNIVQKFRASVRTNVEKLRTERDQSAEDQPKLSDLAILEKAMQEASEEHLTSTTKRKPGWYVARANKLEPLIRARNAAQAAYNARPSDENKRRLQLARNIVKKEVSLAIKHGLNQLCLMQTSYTKARKVMGAT